MPSVITSSANPRVKQLRAALQGNARLASGLLALEGDHMLEEALNSNQALKTIFLTEQREAPTYLSTNIEVLHLTADLFAAVTETRTPQGIAALFVPPVSTLTSILEKPSTPLLVLAVNLQDPGNLGTIIRSALAFGATGLLTTAGTVSPWNQKTMRASAGSIFRLPLATAGLEDIELLKQQGIRLVAAVKDNALPIHQADLTQPTAFLIGNEGAGLSQDWLRLADQRITIPTPGPVESLNAAVAASILLYESSRQHSS